jgi:Cytochrome C'
VCLAASFVAGGCGEGEGGINPPPGGGGMPGGVRPPGIRQIMGKIGRGPGALTPTIGNELKQDPPPWETIQGQAKDYAQSVSELGKYDPPRGAKEAWTKVTADFVETAAELEKAALAKDKEAARSAHDQLQNSCNSCHQEHRRMGRGGGPGGFGPPPGGPGGPGGPPPAGRP